MSHRSDDESTPQHRPSNLQELFEGQSLEQWLTFLELVTPGFPDLLRHLLIDGRDLLNAAAKYDPVAVSALRVVHAVLVATRRKDGTSIASLREWENLTLSFMEKHALDEYVKLPLPPRPGNSKQDRHDRHLIVASLLEQIAKYLRLRDQDAYLQPAGLLEKAANEIALTARLQTMVSNAFPNLESVDDERKGKLLSKRVKAHMETGRPLAELDPEVIFLDALEGLGVPRQTGHNWLRAIK